MALSEGCTLNRYSPLLARTGGEPLPDTGPQAAPGPWPYEHAHVPGVQRGMLLVRAAGESGSGLCLGGRDDVVPPARDVEYGAPDVREAHPVTAELHLSLDELVALVEVSHPPSEGLAGEGCGIVHPLAHRQPRSHGNVPLGPLPYLAQRRIVDAQPSAEGPGGHAHGGGLQGGRRVNEPAR